MYSQMKELKKLWSEFTSKPPPAKAKAIKGWKEYEDHDDFIEKAASAFEKLRPFLSVVDMSVYASKFSKFSSNPRHVMKPGEASGEAYNYYVFPLRFTEDNDTFGIVWNPGFSKLRPNFEQYLSAVTLAKRLSEMKK